MFNRLKYRIHVWRVLRALRRAERASLGHALRVAYAREVLRLVNR